MFKRLFIAAQLLFAGFLLVAAGPSLATAVLDGYSHFPAVLPPSSWALVLRSTGILFLGVGFGLILVLVVDLKRKKSNKGANVLSDSSEGVINLIVNGRKVVGPPALLQSLGTGSGTIYIVGGSIRSYVRGWSNGGVLPTRLGINGIPFDQFEYAED